MAQLQFDQITLLSLVDEPAVEKFAITKRYDGDDTDDTTPVSDNNVSFYDRTGYSKEEITEATLELYDHYGPGLFEQRDVPVGTAVKKWLDSDMNADNTTTTTMQKSASNTSDVSDLELESAVFDAAPIKGMSAKEFLTALQQAPDIGYEGSSELFGESVQKSDGSFAREPTIQQVNRRRVTKGKDPISEEELNARFTRSFVADAAERRNRVQKSELWGNDSFVADAARAEQEAEQSTETERTNKSTEGVRKGRANPGNPDGNASFGYTTSFVSDALD